MQKKLTLIILFLSLSLYVVSQTGTHRVVIDDTIDDSSTVFPADLENNYDQLLTKMAKELKLNDNCSYEDQGLITYPDSVYIERLYALPSQMELSYNPVVRKFIEMYAGRNRKQVSFMLGQGKHYFPLFEQELDKEGLPNELKYLPVIESALNPIARSRVGATGLWQFMLGTGQMFDLEINSLVDERSDPRKSTKAAVKYLKSLYSIYNDWNLVIAAYNCGPGNVNKAMRRSGGMKDYWAIYPYLPRETRSYVPIFVAATYIMSYPHEHGICPAEGELPVLMDTIKINKNLHFQQVADMINMPIEDLRAYNPQFKNDIIPGAYKSYTLNLPLTKATAFIDRQDTIYAHRAEELFTHRKEAGLKAVGSSGRSLNHKVKRGDTLSGIARKYGVSTAQLKRWNSLKSNNVAVGRSLKVSNPVAAVTPTPPKNETNVNNPQLAANSQSTEKVENIDVTSNAGHDGLYRLVQKTKSETVTNFYKVKKGDTWAGISKKQGVSISEIKAANNIKNSTLMAGKSLKIQRIRDVVVVDTIRVSQPQLVTLKQDSTHLTKFLTSYINKMDKADIASFPRIRLDGSSTEDDLIDRANLDASRMVYHKVRIGETIPQIAARYKVSREEIITWNKLSSKVAKVGQRLMIYLPEDAGRISSGV